LPHQIIATRHVEHTGRAYLGVAATDAQQAQAPRQGPGGFFGPGGQGSQTAPAVEGALVESVSGPAAQAHPTALDFGFFGGDRKRGPAAR
jgi:hypothetical protein